MPAHTHSITLKGASSVSGPGVESSDQGTTGSDQTGSSGSDGAHNNVQPTIILSYIIKY
jgi:microcystin-dependent protein